MYHLVYLTTNLINNKFYVGVHSTYNLNDGYLGSGNGIKVAIKKYGKQKFKRVILYYCLTEIDAYKIEEQIVDMNFIKRKDSYNQRLGGDCFRKNRFHSPYTIQKMRVSAIGRKAPYRTEEEKKIIHNKKMKTRIKNNTIKLSSETKNKISNTLKLKNIKGELNPMFGKHLSEEAKQIISIKAKSRKSCTLYKLLVTMPSGIQFSIEGLKNLCELHNLSEVILSKNIGNGIINIKTKKKKSKAEYTNGWKVDLY